MQKPWQITEYGINLDQLIITYSRSSGPGGQNVNKVNTKVDVRFNLNDADWIPEPVRQKFKDSVSSHLMLSLLMLLMIIACQVLR